MRCDASTPPLVPLLLILVLVFNAERVVSFQFPHLKGATTTTPRTNAPVGRHIACHPWQMTQFSVSDNVDNEEDQKHLRQRQHQQQLQQNIPMMNVEDLRRRQLVFSLLASGSLAWTTAVTDAQAADTEELTTSVPSSVLETQDILKPPKDDRQYTAYTLDNGLRVLLCSDPSTNAAAAAMDVHVGACSDPEKVPGIAHFCEHMLFLGTKPYPKEDSFSSFLSSNGGMSNAYTDSENTVYYFDMEAEADERLAEGLDRFGSFFESPLFTVGATGRELNAIESENAKNLQTDSFRVFQMMKSRANSEHPYSKFFTGNKKTLLDDTKAQGINLREELLKFYNRYYSANQMTLAIVAPQPLDKLKKMVSDSFKDVPNRQVDKPEKAWKGTPPFININSGESVVPSYQHIVEIVPVQDLRQVTLTWPIIYQSDEDATNALLTKQSNYVAHMIGHEGPGSLLSYLKRMRWANSLASSSESELSDFETFEVTVGLTTAGLVAIDNVVEAIFSYLSLLRNKAIPDYVFKEVLQVNELEWRFATKGNPSSYAQSLAPAMQRYPPSLYVAGPRRLVLAEPKSKLLANSAPRTSFSSREQLEDTKTLVDDFVSRLTLEKALITVMSKTFDGKADKTEKWYGTNYSVKPIPAVTVSQWRNCAAPRKFKIDYPKPNSFIPSEAGLRVKLIPMDKPVTRDFESRMIPIPSPTLIRDDGPGGRWSVYFKQDDRFGLPKAFVVLQLLTTEVFSSARRAALSLLYELCLSDRLTEYAYDAGLAGLTYEVKVLPRGVRLTFGGYNDKLDQFASYIVKKISKDVNDVLPKSDEEFVRYKDQIDRGLAAFDVKQPYAHASYFASLCIQPQSFQYSNQQLRDAISTAARQDLLSYASSVWSSGQGEALVQGNLDKFEALSLVDKIDKTLAFQTIGPDEVPEQLVPLPLPKASPPYPKSTTLRRTRLVISEPNASNGNSASHVTVQSLGESEKDHVLLEIISAIVEQPFYDDLRTKQQLGYIVASGIRPLGKSRTLNFIVQSSVAPAAKLTTETLNFMDTIHDQLEKLPKLRFGTFVKGLIDRKTEADKILAQEVQRNWGEIASGRLEFDRVQRETRALLDLEKEDLVKFWDQIYSSMDSRVLLTQMIPVAGPASSPRPPISTGYASLADKRPPDGLVLGAEDISQFRKDLEEGLTK